MSMMTDVFKRVAGPRATVLARCVVRGYGLPRWGNLRRTTPFSSNFGFERGTPLDRYYLHRFLDQNRKLITGRVLEVQNNGYTRRFGVNVTEGHSFDIIPNFSPTYLCDFARCGDIIPDASYDCLLLPNTLSVFKDIEPSLVHAWRVIRPGGAIVATAAGIVPLTGDAPDYWRFSPAGWHEKLAVAWPPDTFEVEGHGNVLAAIAAQLGLAHEELSPEELDVHDPCFPVLTTIVGRKSGDAHTTDGNRS